jgi:hypothetical protein
LNGAGAAVFVNGQVNLGHGILLMNSCQTTWIIAQIFKITTIPQVDFPPAGLQLPITNDFYIPNILLTTDNKIPPAITLPS